MATDLAAEREAATPTPATKRVRFVETRETYVDLPVEEADAFIEGEVDVTDIAETLTRLRRVARGNLNEHAEGGLCVKDASHVKLVGGWDPTPLDGTGRPSYLWTARSKVADARYELSVGRYCEGNCPELDQANRDLGVIEERLRTMALAVDGLGPDHRPLDRNTDDDQV